jgi:hypothetical protein
LTVNQAFGGVSHRTLSPKPRLMRRFATLLVVLLVVSLAPSAAVAGDNDITLQRFGACQGSGLAACARVTVDEGAFRLLARDLGLVMFPRLRASAETLGQAGFAFQIDHSFSVVDAQSDYWERASVEESPNGTLSTTQIHIRKGLPMSLELGAMATFLWQSDLVAIGGELKWAFHEDTLWPVPDLMFRAFGNTVLGHPQLVLTNVGADVVVGVPFGAGGVVNLTPYAGYTMLVIIAGTQIIDATPGDPLPPVVSSDATLTNQPEFSFDVESQLVHQALVGLRLQMGVVNAVFEVNANSAVQTYGLSLGLDF